LNVSQNAPLRFDIQQDLSLWDKEIPLENNGEGCRLKRYPNMMLRLLIDIDTVVNQL